MNPPLKSNRAKPVLAVFATVAVLLLTACGGGSSSAGASDSDGGSSGAYDIGIATTLSGEQAAAGEALVAGTKTYLKQHPDVNGHPVKLHILDTRFDPTVVATDVRQLQSQKVNAFLDFFSSAEYTAAAPLVGAAKIPAFGRGFVSTFNSQPYVFGTAPPIEFEAAPAVDFAATLPDVQGKSNVKAWVLTEQSPASSALYDAYKSAVTSKGWSFDGKQVPPTSTDLSAQATAAVAAKPTVVLVGDIAPITESFVKALRQQGYQGPIVANDLASDLSTLKTINDTNFYVDRYYAFVDDSSSSSEIKAIAAAAKAVGADPTAPFFMDGYAQTLVLMQALGKCGYPCSGPDLSQAIMGLGQVKSDIFPGGPAEFSQDWHVGPRSVQFYKWDGSKPVATGDPQPLGS